MATSIAYIGRRGLGGPVRASVRIAQQFRSAIVFLCHTAVVTSAFLLAFLLRFEFDIPAVELPALKVGIWVFLAVKLLFFQFGGLFRGGWRHVGIVDLTRIFYVNVAAQLAAAILVFGITSGAFPRSVVLMDFLLCFTMTAALRFAFRIYREALRVHSRPGDGKRVLIYGAGAAGAALVREIKNNDALKAELVGFLDDNPAKLGTHLMGVRILSRGRDAVHVVEDQRQRNQPIDEIIIAMPSASGLQMREAVANCRAAGVKCKTVPGISDLLEGRFLSQQLRDVLIEDLLGRQPVHLESAAVRSKIAGKSVMVTGGAGSIGSELCRQLGALQPKLLTVLDQAESDLYRVELELRRTFPKLNMRFEVGDIRDRGRVDEVVVNCGVEVIFHAAAYKHVPMMESNVLEAVKNNILGTRNVAEVAARRGVSRMVLISSDKAVNPSSVMGATKRAAELVLEAMSEANRQSTIFVSVRFGNVLGSKGSVVPLFREQIAQGGPLTVTHPDVTRYFMTTREAVHLVLQAFSMGEQHEVFVLDMGEPVRVLDLARNMIRLSGLEPDKDVEIHFTGLRPGEKLFEELITSGETMKPTQHARIRVFQGQAQSSSEVRRFLDQLEESIRNRDEREVLSQLRKLIPEFQPQPSTASLRIKPKSDNGRFLHEVAQSV